MSREPMPFSILFQDPEAGFDAERCGEPDFFADLNLDQVFAAAAAGRDEYNLHSFFRCPLERVSAIGYRQDVFRDIEEGLSGPIEEFARDMRRVRGHLVAADRAYDRYEKAAWFLDGAEIYCDAVLALSSAVAAFGGRSEGFKRCAAYLSGYVGTDAFEGLLKETKRLKAELAGIRYCVRVRGSRVIVTDYHGEPDYSVEVLETFRRFQQGDAKSRLVKYSPEFNTHVQQRIVELVAGLHPKLFASLLSHCQADRDFLDPVIVRFDREAQFYLAYLAFIARLKKAGLTFCYPVVSESSKDIEAQATFDVALANKLVSEERAVVCNDFHLRGGERILVVTGPNQGGKTTFARSFGQLHYLAALGCPVPASSARLFLCDRIFAHFERQEQVEDLHGKLEEELLRVREVLRGATDRSIVIMNESLASTTAEDALFLGREVIGRLIELDALAVYVTFIDELSRLGPTVVSMVSTVVPENPAERTFNIVRQPADGRAYATAIAEKHGLTYKSIKSRVRR